MTESTVIIIASNVVTVFVSVAVNRTDISWLKKRLEALELRFNNYVGGIHVSNAG